MDEKKSHINRTSSVINWMKWQRRQVNWLIRNCAPVFFFVVVEKILVM